MARSLWPREHGVYVEVAAPLLSGLVVAPSVAGALFSTCIVHAFLVHEPLLVLIGGRGKRQRQLLRAAATKRALTLASIALVAGLVGYFLAPSPARMALLPMTVCGLLTLGFVWRGAEKTKVGELLVALSFSLAFAPIALSHGSQGMLPWMVCGIWFVIFGLQTLAVHAVKSRDHRQGCHIKWLAGATVVLAGVGAMAISSVFIALVAPAVVTMATPHFREGPRRLRRIGWAFAGADITALVVLTSCWYMQ